MNKRNEVLILQRSNDEEVFPNMWEIPSGKRELLESSENCLIRELKEETNLDIKTIMPFSVFDYQIKKIDEIRDSTQINFLVKTVNSDKVKISQEHQSFAWISKDEINKYELSENIKKVILNAFNLV